MKKNYSVRIGTEDDGAKFVIRYTDGIGVVQTKPLTGATTRAEAKQMAEAEYYKVSKATEKRTESDAERRKRLIEEASKSYGNRWNVGEAITKWELEQKESGALSPLFITKRAQIVRRWAFDMGCMSKLPSEIEIKDIAQWINGEAIALKVHTRAVFMSHLKNFFDWCYHSGLSFTNPPRQIGKINTRGLPHKLREKRVRKIYTKAEVERFVKAADELVAEEFEKAKKHNLYGIPKAEDEVYRRLRLTKFVKYAFLISVRLGLRISDICDLQHQQFETPGHITVWTHKRDKRVKLKLDADMMKLFEEVGAHPAESIDDLWLFPEAHEEHSKNVSDPVLPRTNVHWRTSIFERICDRAGIKGKVFHDCRATAIYNFRKEGKSMPHIAKLVGHSDTRTTEGYIAGADPEDEEEHEAIETIEYAT